MRELLKPLLISGLIIAAALGIVSLRFNATVRSWLADFMAPFQAEVAAPTDATGESLYGYSSSELIQRVQGLDRTVADQREEIRRLQTALEQQREVADVQNLSLPPKYRAVVGSVTNRDPTQGGNRLRINIGQADGLAIGQPVLANRCLLGRVFEVSDHSATVLTIRDANCRVSVEVADRGLYGILSGEPESQWLIDGTCMIEYLPRDTAFRKGERVVTSELGQVVPPGIPVGTLVPNAQGALVETYHNLYSIARLRPAYATSRFRVVVVLVNEP